jgi:hypothetical protein
VVGVASKGAFGYVLIMPARSGAVSYFPPSSSTTLQNIIPSYLYQQYSDDDDLQAFIIAYNELAQEVFSWFNTVNLPVYTQLSGALLDWVAEGLYGISRPTLINSENQNWGTYNTNTFNTLVFNGQKQIGQQTYYLTTDDLFKRIITWGFYKGDGRTFNISWLKRRIMRFLLGANGTSPNIDNTYQISVSFGVGNQVNITIVSYIRTFTSGGFNTVPFNAQALNGSTSTVKNFAPLAYSQQLKAAISAGAIELPFQFTYVVNIEG